MVAERIAQILLEDNPDATPAEWERIVESFLQKNEEIQSSILGTAGLCHEQIRTLDTQKVFDTSKKILLDRVRKRIQPR